MKLLVEVSSKKICDYVSLNIDGIILGLEKFSSSFNEVFSIDEIKEIKEKYNSLEIFISLNKTMMNSDLIELEKVLLELDKLNINGVLFYDLAILNLKHKLNLKLDLVWNQTHMVTNYNTCNYYYDKGVKYAYLSSEITMEEIMEINKKSNIKTFCLFLGYPVMAVSKRSLLTNYFKYHKKEIKPYLEVFEKASNNKVIVSESDETSFYNGKVINGIIPFYNLLDSVDYGILKEQYIDRETFFKICKLFNMARNNEKEKEEVVKEVNELIGTYDGFFFKKTIYKVKKND